MFIYAYHTILPVKKKGEDQKLDEQISFSRTLNKTKLSSATYIIDLLNNKCIKNRYRHDQKNPVTDEHVINYFCKEYQQEIIEELQRGKNISN